MFAALKGTEQDDLPNPVLAAWITEGQHLSGPAPIQSTNSLTASAIISSTLSVPVGSVWLNHTLYEYDPDGRRATQAKKERPNESFQNLVAEPEALAASSPRPVGASPRSLSRATSLGRQKSQKARSGRSHAEACTHVLFKHYLDLVDRDRAQGMQKPGMEKTKGLASLFLIMCSSLPDDAVTMLAGGFAMVAPVITMAGGLLILPLLWFTRLVFTTFSPALALILLLTGVCCLLTAEQIALASAAEQVVKSQPGGLSPSIRQTAAATSRRGYTYFQTIAQASGGSGASANPRDSAGHAPSAPAAAASAARGSSSSASTSGGGKTVIDAGLLKEVRTSMTRLEAELYGNEMTDGLLPADVLPSRIQRLCEDVGIPGLKQGAGAADMLKALHRVEAEVGV